MTASLFGTSSNVNVNVAGSLVPQAFVGTATQVLFNITAFTYTPGTNSLLVFINGQRQISGRDFVESSNSSFTLVEGVVAGDFVDIIGFPLTTLTQVLPAGMPYQWAGVGGQLQTVDSKLQQTVFLFDIITAAEKADALTGTPTIDLSARINTAFATAITITINEGANILTRFPINMTARRDTSNGGKYSARRLIGQGGSARCVINGYTGVYPVIDLTGSSNCAVEGINIRSDNATSFGLPLSANASIGLFNCRGSTVSFNTSCTNNRFSDLRFNMTSDMTRNSGRGTIGILNIAGEHLENKNFTQIYANLPLVSWNTAQAVVAHSSDIPGLGVNYEPVYAGSSISNTVHSWGSMILVAYDSFRAIEMQQAAGVSFSNLYTSTRSLNTTIPSFIETILMADCSSVSIPECYQETSGLFGAVYKMDHAYITFSGTNENINVRMQRATGDSGFTIPGTSVESIRMLANSYLANSDINCNYTIGIYNSSGDNNGFANLPVTMVGTNCQLKNVKFTLDHAGSHSADIFSAIAPYCTNVDSINYLSADNYFGNTSAAFNPSPTVVGTTVAGVGTYTTQLGYYSKSGRTLQFHIELAWSAHTGTGNMQINGLPFAAWILGDQAVSVSFNGLAVGTPNKQFAVRVNANTQTMTLLSCDVPGGAFAAVPMDTVVGVLDITGSIHMAGSL